MIVRLFAGSNFVDRRTPEEPVQQMNGLILGALLASGPALGQMTYDDATTPEGWAFAQLKRGEIADFRNKCTLADQRPAPAACRTLSHQFIEDIASGGNYASAIPHQGVRVNEAIVAGDINLEHAAVSKAVLITNSRIDGSINLTRARFAFGLSLEGSVINGKIDASGLQVGSNLRLENAEAADLNLIGASVDGFAQFSKLKLKQKATLNNARIGKDLLLADITAGGGIMGRALWVGGNAYLKDQSSGPDIDLGDATIGVDLSIGGKLGDIFFDSIHIGSSLHMGPGTYRGINVSAARVDHVWDMSDAKIAGSLQGHAMHVAQDTRFNDTTADHIDFRNARFDGDLTIVSVTVADQWNGPGMHVAGTLDVSQSEIHSRDNHWPALDLSHAHVGEDLRLTDTNLLNTRQAVEPGAKWPPINLRFTRIGANLDLSGTILSGLDLSGATIDSILQLSDTTGHGTCWQAPAAQVTIPPEQKTRKACENSPDARLILLNARVGMLGGSTMSTWPSKIQLLGLGYSHLAPFDGAPENSQAETWKQWLERDDYKSQPYAQLASVLAAGGDRDGAASIQYFARERERALAWNHRAWGTYIPLTVLWAVAGYGIGDYTWRALGWVIGLTLLGAVLVHTVRDQRAKGRLWPIGASLAKLLPVHLDPSFNEFFERQEGFKWWHKFAFCVLALAGSALGLFLAAAASGLTQKG